MRIDLLGRFAVLVDGREQPLSAFGGRKTRLLLRVLATRRGSPVDHDTLSSALWGDDPPRDPSGNLGVLVNRARSALTDGGLIRTVPGGYLLDQRCAVDAAEFESGVRRARHEQARGELAAALADYLDALALWGSPLPEDADAPWADGVRQHWSTLHRAARLEGSTLALDLGQPTLAVEIAAPAVREDPLDEAACIALMTAQAAAGQNAAALASYDRLRHALAEELGVDPSPPVRAAHLAILTGTARPAPAAPAGPPATRFAGRRAELTAVLGALGSGRRVEVLGAGGWGKSRFLDEVALRLPEELTLCPARATLPERDEPWSLLRALLGPVAARTPGLLDHLPERTRAAVDGVLQPGGGAGADLDPSARRALVAAGLVAVLAALDRPVLVLDDLQWADEASAGALAAALDRRPDTGCVVAARPAEVRADGGTRSLLAALGRDRLLVELAPLSEDDVAEVAGPVLAPSICGSAGATPFEVMQVLTGLGSEGLAAPGGDGTWRPVTAGATDRARDLALAGTRQTLLATVAARPALEQQVVRLLALLGRAAPSGTLAVAARRPATEVEEALDALCSAGLVRATPRGWATGHDLLSEAVDAALPTAEAARLHRALAATIEDPPERAAHLAGAGDPDAAAAAYAAAARALLEARSAGDAATLATRGLALASRGADRAELHDARAMARSLTGDLPGARDDLRTALRLRTPGPDRARLMARLAMSYSGADDPERAHELSELALVEAGDDPAARAVALEVASILDVNRGDDDRARSRSEEARSLYAELGDAVGTARILDARAMATFLSGDIRTAERLFDHVAGVFEDCGDLFRELTPRSTQGHALVFLGRPADGLAAATSSLELARELSHPEGETYALWHRSEALAALGDPTRARADAEEALAIAEQIGHRGWTATSFRALGIAHLAADDVARAHEAFERSLAHADGLDLFRSWAAAHLAICEVRRGELDAARGHVAAARSCGPGLARYEARWAEAELAAASGRDPAPLVARAVVDAERGGHLASAACLRAVLA